MKVKMDNHFFGVKTPRGKTPAQIAKTPQSVGTRPVGARGTYCKRPFLTQKVTLISDLKLRGRLFFCARAPSGIEVTTLTGVAVIDDPQLTSKNFPSILKRDRVTDSELICKQRAQCAISG